MKRALRTLVLKTEAFPPLGGLYRALYHIAVGVVTILIRAHPEFHALFLRGSYARGDFRPGRSDLDFVFVTRKGLDDNTLFRLLSRTRRAFSLLKAVVPFLGEFEILEEETFRSWLAHNPDRKELRSPGRDPLADLEDPRELELLRKDLTDFVYLWQPNLTVWNQSELDRLFDKTTRLCGLSTPSLSNTTYRRWQQTAYLLQHFDQACRSWRPARGAARVAMVPSATPDPIRHGRSLSPAFCSGRKCTLRGHRLISRQLAGQRRSEATRTNGGSIFRISADLSSLC